MLAFVYRQMRIDHAVGVFFFIDQNKSFFAPFKSLKVFVTNWNAALALTAQVRFSRGVNFKRHKAVRSHSDIYGGPCLAIERL